MSRLALASLLLALAACQTPPPRWEVRQLGIEPLAPLEQVEAVAVVAPGEPLVWASYQVLEPGQDRWRPRALARSEDAGLSWKQVPAQGLGDVLCLAAGPGVLLVGNEDGLWISRDGGARFERAGWEPPADAIPMFVAVAPFDPARLFCVTQDGQVHASRDGGASWAACPPCEGSPAGILPLPGRVLLLNAVGLFSWSEGQASWTRLCTHGFPAPGGLAASADGGLIVATTRTPGEADQLARSTDGGRTWSLLRGVRSVADVALDPGDPAALYALTTSEGGSVWVSRDRGESWSPLSGDLARDHGLGSGSDLQVLAGRTRRPSLFVACRTSRQVRVLEDPGPAAD